MAVNDSPDHATLDGLIAENLAKINKYVKQSETSKKLLEDFLELTRLDFEGADKESKELDALLRDYNGGFIFAILTNVH